MKINAIKDPGLRNNAPTLMNSIIDVHEENKNLRLQLEKKHSEAAQNHENYLKLKRQEQKYQNLKKENERLVEALIKEKKTETKKTRKTIEFLRQLSTKMGSSTESISTSTSDQIFDTNGTPSKNVYQRTDNLT